MKLYVYLFLTACVFTAVGGITGLGLFLIGGLLLYLFFLYRGLLFIQSYLYLKILWETGNPSTANYFASNLKLFESGKYMAESVRYAEKMFGGMQLPVIIQARELGFGSKHKNNS